MLVVLVQPLLPEIGTMKVTEQIDALKVMATNPTTYLVVPRFLAIVLMMPVLIVFANTIGNIGGWLVSHYYAGISTFTYINSIKSLLSHLIWSAVCLKVLFLAVLLLL